MVPVMKGGDGARWPDCHYGLMNPLRKSNLTFSHTHTHTPDWSIAYVTWDLYTHLIAIVRAKVTVHQYVYTAHQLHAAQHGTQHGRKTSTSSWHRGRNKTNTLSGKASCTDVSWTAVYCRNTVSWWLGGCVGCPVLLVFLLLFHCWHCRAETPATHSNWAGVSVWRFRSTACRLWPKP